MAARVLPCARLQDPEPVGRGLAVPAVSVPNLRVRELLLPAGTAAFVRLSWAGAPGWASPPMLLALAATVLLLWQMPARRAGPRDVAGFALALAAIALPGGLPWLALPCLAVLALPGAHLAGVLLLGLGAEGLSHGLAGQLVLVPVVAAEAWATATLANLCGTPAHPSGAAVLLPHGRVLLLLRACSVVSLFWPTLLATLALPALLHRATRPVWGPALAALGLMLLLNLLRLLAMALSPGAHAFLHTPAGEELTEITFALPLLLALVSVPPCAGR